MSKVIKPFLISATIIFLIGRIHSLSQDITHNVYTISASGDVTDICTEYMDSDNNIDIVYTSWEDGFYICYGDGAGSCDSESAYLSGKVLKCIQTDLINSDSLPDIMTADNDSIYVLFNNGNKSFSIVKMPFTLTSLVTLPLYFSLSGGFFNDDAYRDIMIAGFDPYDFPPRIFLGDGYGGFDDPITVPLSGWGTVNVHDYNVDGADDFARFEGNTATIYLNNGDATFYPSASIGLPGAGVSIASGKGISDINGDGFYDFAVYSTDSQEESDITLIYSDGAGGILDSRTIHWNVKHEWGTNITVTDIDRDYDLDIAFITELDGQLLIYFGDGDGNFSGPQTISMPLPGLNLYSSAGDFDRDGNSDIVISTIDNLFIIMENLLPDHPVLDDEMVTTGLNSVSLEIINPEEYVIKETYQTVAGSAYRILDVNEDEINDEMALDYNLQYGEYRIVISPGIGGDAQSLFSVGIRVNGTEQATIFRNYISPWAKKGDGDIYSDSIVFYYTIESVSSIEPANGQTTNLQPSFDWSELADDGNRAEAYHFQLDAYYDFRSPIYNVDDLIVPEITLAEPLGADSVFYWHFRAHDGTDWSEYSRTFAVYAVDFNCGDTNGDDDVNILDIVYLINYKYKSGPAPEPLISADVNNDSDINILDIVYLINYKYNNGPEPVCQ
jgi:hypothetical protein